MARANGSRASKRRCVIDTWTSLSIAGPRSCLQTIPPSSLFEVFSQRYEHGSTIITSNLPFEEWTSVFGSERLTGALLDRLTHHVHILTMNGDSYRLAQSAARRRQHSKSEQNAVTADDRVAPIPARFCRTSQQLRCPGTRPLLAGSYAATVAWFWSAGDRHFGTHPLTLRKSLIHNSILPQWVGSA